MEAIRIQASPKQLSRLRNGHRVSVKPAMEGCGVCLVIDPSRYNEISRTFSKGKGKMVQLTPEEIMANREIGGEGIFGTLAKGAKTLAKSKLGKSLAKTAIDTAVASAGMAGVPPSVAKMIGKEAKGAVEGYGILDTVAKGAKSLAKSKLGKSLAKSAIDTAVASSGVVGLPPSVAKMIGKEAKKQVEGYGLFDTVAKGAKALAKSKLGKSLAKSAIDTAVASSGVVGLPPSVAKMIGKEAKKQVEGYGILDTVAKGAKALAKSKLGKSLAKSAIDTAVASAGMAGVPPSVARMIGKEAKGAVEGYGLYAGSGLYAGARSRGMGVMGRGALMGVHNSHLPPALQSQNMSANFSFRTQLPPALADLK